MCSDSQESSASLPLAAGRPTIQVTCPPACAQALATSLVECISSKAGHCSAAAYPLLCQLALADVQAGSERMKGVAQHAATAVLQVTFRLT